VGRKGSNPDRSGSYEDGSSVLSRRTTKDGQEAREKVELKLGLKCAVV
jgi:hypothetical protein